MKYTSVSGKPLNALIFANAIVVKHENIKIRIAHINKNFSKSMTIWKSILYIGPKDLVTLNEKNNFIQVAITRKLRT